MRECCSAPPRQAWSRSRHRCRERTASIVCVAPILLVHGDSDGVLPDLCSRNVYERATSARSRDLVVLPGEGHLLDGQAAAGLDEQIVTFLQAALAVAPRAADPGVPPRPYDGRVPSPLDAISMGEPIKTEHGFVASPFTRLARTHGLMVAGDTFVAVALAGSLFFDITPDAARWRIALYLLLTVAPFAVVAPWWAPLSTG